ncbi:radical SAM family heme chaperone HemW [Evansella sp. AB-P1]|uniref:radical SAM family heme chaperone HemW n=1 Tax=Evansella sp. AB-P1 TaxID=3037653 RepID=UPI00241C4B39|nr:radical SAM family heme chaperone HemW [Evansella sp. AB-P1]MDG5786530.1 radical SAM family heme chaperone HemW [Evansella sp. AB-P1]
MNTRAVYIHVPFCEQICHYCDFNKFYIKNQPIEEYLDLCEKEMANTIERFPTSEVTSIYVGGGTPTSLSTEHLSKLLRAIRTHFPIRDDYEWTVEVNPGSADNKKLEMMKEMGVNRLSIGVQTFDQELLKTIGRDHNPEDVSNTIKLARNNGFSNISLDLMFGLPNQTMDQFRETLERTMDMQIEHVSAYSLKIEAKTVFYQLMKKGKLSLPSEDLEADMYHVLREQLEKANLQQYEISNFAKRGFESKHNLTYWNNESYFGIGAGSHSYINGVRRANYGPLPKYMKAVQSLGFPYIEEHEVTFKEKMEEEMFMGLRKISGVSFKTFREKYGMEIEDTFKNIIPPLTEKGLLINDGTSIRLSNKGLFLGNEVFEKFLM